MEDKYCLITLGPTGSGKSGLKDIVSNYLSRKKGQGHYEETGKLLKNKSEAILIDDIVEEHPHYKHKVNEILGDKSPGRPSVTRRTLSMTRTRQQIAESPKQEERKAFEDAYWQTRKLIDCEDDKFQDPLPCNFVDVNKPWWGPTPECSATTCDKINDNRLETAIRENKNITFETTGASSVSWLSDMIDKVQKDEKGKKCREYQKANYKYVFVYSYVEIGTLIGRVLDRAQDKIINFKIDDKKAPRLPDIKEILNNIIKISTFFNDMVDSIKKIGSNNDCYLIIVDNTQELTESQFAGLTSGVTHTSGLIRFCGHFNQDKCKFTIFDNKNKLSYYSKVPENWTDAYAEVIGGPKVSKTSPTVSQRNRKDQTAARIVNKIELFMGEEVKATGKKPHTLSKRRSVSGKPSKKRRGPKVGKRTSKGNAGKKRKGTRKGKGKKKRKRKKEINFT